MNKKTLLIICVVFLAVLIAASLLYSGLSGQVERDSLATQPPETTQAALPSETAGETVETTEPVDYSAPDFTVLDGDGNECRLSDFEGKPVILNFWASWCGPCKSEMPDFQEAYEKYGGDIQFMMVNCTDGSRETVDTAKAFITDAGYTFPVFFDTTYEAASIYGASSIPMTFFIDTAGDLVAYGTGALDADTLQRGIDMIYAPAEGT